MLITIILLSSNVYIFAESTSLNIKERAIISQAISLDKSEKIHEENFSIVSLTTNSADARSVNNTSTETITYPECLTEDLSSTLVDDYFFIRSTIDENNPVKGQVYIDGNNTMAQNRVLRLTNYFEHGGLIYLQLTYSVNGTNYTHDRNYDVYSK